MFYGFFIVYMKICGHTLSVWDWSLPQNGDKKNFQILVAKKLLVGNFMHTVPNSQKSV
jgi:hypothetical protein